MTAKRGFAAMLALVIIATGTGLPMCVSLFAQAARPCDMHSSGHGDSRSSHARHSATVVSQPPGQGCHDDAGPVGCATTACPTAGAASTVAMIGSVSMQAPSRIGIVGKLSTFTSYSAPPLSPPPQA